MSFKLSESFWARPRAGLGRGSLGAPGLRLTRRLRLTGSLRGQSESAWAATATVTAASDCNVSVASGGSEPGRPPGCTLTRSSPVTRSSSPERPGPGPDSEAGKYPDLEKDDQRVTVSESQSLSYPSR